MKRLKAVWFKSIWSKNNKVENKKWLKNVEVENTAQNVKAEITKVERRQDGIQES